MKRGHAEALMPMIDEVMKASGISYASLERIAVTVGPGSFTGLRVGIAAARGIALASGKPAIGLSTLAALAAPHLAAARGEATVAAIDARHGRVYLQVFDAAGEVRTPACVATVAEAVRAAHPGPARIVGSGAPAVAAAWPSAEAPPVAVEAAAAPDIEWVARLGAFMADETGMPAPLYLQEPDVTPQDSAKLPRR
jgi:tRNA threonylcarbamoyladenosine biosynthesis protein TsaB